MKASDELLRKAEADLSLNALFVKGAIQKLARAISSGKTVTLSTRMPLSPTN